MSMQADAGNPYVVANIYSTDGHFTKQFSGKKIREKLGKMLPFGVKSDAAKWKHMLQDKKYTRNCVEGFVQKKKRVYAHEYNATHRTIVDCAVLGREFNDKEKRYFLRIKYWWRDNSGQYTSETIEVPEDSGDRLYDREEHH